jgi:hypothetical protein
MSPLAHGLLWLSLCMALAMGIALDACGPAGEGSRIRCIPARGPGYCSFDIPMERGAPAPYRRAFVLRRCYRMGTSRFMLIVVDGSGGLQPIVDLLRPLAGNGWPIQNGRQARIRGGSCTILRTGKGSPGRETAYWFSDGSTRHGSFLRYLLQYSLRRLSLGRFGREPLLVMIRPADGYPGNPEEIMNQFGALFEI